MAKNETTSPDIASLAARALRKPGSITKKQIKSLAGAALTQAADTIKGLVTPAAPAKPKAAKPKAAKPKAAKPKPAAAAKPKSAAKPKAAKPAKPRPKAK